MLELHEGGSTAERDGDRCFNPHEERAIGKIMHTLNCADLYGLQRASTARPANQCSTVGDYISRQQPAALVSFSRTLRAS